MPLTAMSAAPNNTERIKVLNSYGLGDDAADLAAMQAFGGSTSTGGVPTSEQQQAYQAAGWLNPPQAGGSSANDIAKVVTAFGTAVPAVMSAVRNQPINIQTPAMPLVRPSTAWYDDWKIWLAVGIGVVALGAGAFVLTKSNPRRRR
jgi:hypothetical protein